MNDLSFRPPATIWKIEVTSDVAAVLPQWETLEVHATAFQTRGWLLPWYRIVAPRFAAQPLFVTVREGASGRPVMLFPLCKRRRHGILTIEFPDLNVSDYNAPLIAGDFDPSADEMKVLWARIRRALPRADLVFFDKVPALLDGRENLLARLDGFEKLDVAAWLLTLPPTKAEYDDRIITKKARKENRRKKKNLSASLGEYKFIDAATPAEGEAIFEALCIARRARFGVTNNLDDPCFNAFYREVIFGSWGQFAILSALKTNDRVLAMLFAIHQNGNYMLLMHSFAPDLGALSPGVIAIDEAIGHRIVLGDRSFDFAFGDEGYKKQFGVSETVLLRGLYPLSPLGRLYCFALPHAKRFKFALGEHLRKWRNGLTKRPPAPPAQELSPETQI